MESSLTDVSSLLCWNHMDFSRSKLDSILVGNGAVDRTTILTAADLVDHRMYCALCIQK